MKRTVALLAGFLATFSFLVFASDDWPEWRGPNRSGVSGETGLLTSWPEGGPRVLWSIESLGKGYGTVSTSGDRLFVQGTDSEQSTLYCLNRSNGTLLWRMHLGPSLDQDKGGGPRGAPTVDEDRVYALTENGDLACLKVSDGSILWQRNILTDFEAKNPYWRISESPLVDQGKVIVTPGGPDALMVALDKMSGKTIWTSKGLSDGAAYSSCLAVDVDGVRLYITITASNAVGIRASDGKLMWTYAPVANKVANITTPLFHDNKVFFTTAYGTGAALLKLSAEGGEVKAEEVYFTQEMQNHHGGVVLVDGYLYGFSNQILTCMKFDTGERMWRNRSVGKGSLTYANGHLYLLSESNVVGLAEATPEGYREKGRFSIADQGWPSWAHPVVSGGTLYIRNQKTLTAYDVRR